MEYSFPGNVRELEHMVEQAVALVGSGLVTIDDLLPQAKEKAPQAEERTLAAVVDAAEKSAIWGALRDSEGSREKAAQTLHISPTTLWRKMTRLGISFD
jgi:two-component system response regulator HydG